MLNEAVSSQTDLPTTLVETLAPETAMDYTHSLSIAELTELATQPRRGEADKIQVQPVGLVLGADGLRERLFAPTTMDGKKIVFELSANMFHDISEHHAPAVQEPHHTSRATSVPIHIHLNDEAAGVLKKFDDYVKWSFRNYLKSNKQKLLSEGECPQSAMKSVVECAACVPLVKSTSDGKNVMAADMVLDNSDVPTQIIFIKPDKTTVEGYGSEFLLQQLSGEIANLKEYSCNPTMEFAWMLFKEADNAYRLRVKVHSIVLKAKIREPPTKRLKISSGKLAGLIEQLPCFTSSF